MAGGMTRPGLVLAVAASLLLPVAALAAAGVAPIFAASALAAALIAWRAGRLGPALRRGPWVLLALLGIWALATAPFALDPAASFRLAGVVLPSLAGALIVADAASGLGAGDRTRLGAWLLVSWVIGLALLGFEIASGNAIALHYQNALRGVEKITPAWHNRAATVLLLTFPPLALLQWRAGRRGRAALVIGLSALALLNAESATVKLALLAGGLAGLLAAWTGPRFARAVGWLGGLAVLAAPLLGRLPFDLDQFVASHPEVKISGLHRFYIWRFATDRIAEHPWRGWGLDSTRRMPGADGVTPVGGEYMALHPHSGPLQLWLDLGLPGALLLALLVAWLLRAAWGLQSPAARLACVGAAVAALVVFALSFGVWQAWWMGLLALSAALVVAAAYAPDTKTL
jgi:O-antigen ligase